jgi:HSP20 family protein
MVGTHVFGESLFLRDAVQRLLEERFVRTCHESTVTIRATVPPAQSGRDSTPLVRELGVGPFARTIHLPHPIDADKVETSFVDGILTRILPKAEWSKPRKIAINAKPERVMAKSVN